jgi:hypothetical protein
MIETVASFSVWSPKLSPPEITAVLGATADEEVLKGVERVPSRNLPRAHGWHLVEECTHVVQTEDCLAKLMDRVSIFQSRLSRLRAMDPECTLKIVIHLSRSRVDLSISFSEEMLSRLATLSISVFVSVVDLSEGNA